MSIIISSKRWMSGILVALLMMSLNASAAESASAPPAAEKVKIAVLDLTAAGAKPELASTVTSLVAAELQRLQVFSVITNQDLRAILSHEALQQMAGCDGADGCTSKISGTIGARYLLSGSVGQVNNTYALNLVVNDVEKGVSVARVSETIADAGHIADATALAARKVVAPLLSERQGVLLVTCSEQGASVKVDGEVVGVTPIARRPISWGPHEIVVEKQGFVAGMEDISINGSELVERHFGLIPSQDFLKNYEGSARGMRVGAWITTGAAVAALGGAVYFQVDHTRIANNFLQQRTTYEALANPTQAQYDSLATMHQQATSAINWTYGLAAVSGACAVTSVIFWITGGDPNQYKQYREAFNDNPRPGTISLQFASADGMIGARLALP